MARLPALLVCTALCLAACGGDGGGNLDSASTSHLHKKKDPNAAPAGPTREEQTAGMVSAASPARSTPIAELKFDIPSRPEAGKPVGVDLALLPMGESSNVTLELSGSDGLAVPNEDTTASFADVTRAHVYRKSVVVTPAGEGVYFLSVVATFRNADFSDTRNFTVPIIAGPAGAVHAAPAGGSNASPSTAASAAQSPKAARH